MFAMEAVLVPLEGRCWQHGALKSKFFLILCLNITSYLHLLILNPFQLALPEAVTNKYTGSKAGWKGLDPLLSLLSL